MTIESPGPPARLASIQYLRAAAAFGVLLFHATITAGHPLPWVGYGVTLFFVISGFVMVWITDAGSRPRQFLLDRIRRVVPLYWLATGAAALLFVLQSHHRPGLKALAASLLFVPYGEPGVGRHYFPLLVVGWTLNYEMMFYLLFGAALLLPRRLQLAALTTVLVALAAVGHLLRPSTAPLEFWCGPFVLAFLVGAWLAATVAPDRAGIPRRLAAPALVGALCLSPGSVPAAALIAAGLWLDRRRKAKGVAPFLYLGDASYSIYLWHYLAIAVGAAVAFRLHLRPALLLPTLLVAGLLPGLAAFHALERPLLRLLKRPGRPTGPPRAVSAESDATPPRTAAAAPP